MLPIGTTTLGAVAELIALVAGLLLFVALVHVAFERGVYLLLSRVLRLVVSDGRRNGADGDSASYFDREKGEWFVPFAELLVLLGTLTPGREDAGPLTIIAPLFVLAVPAALVLFGLLWLVPMGLFSVASLQGPEPWGVALGAVAVVAYFGCFLCTWELVSRVRAA